MFKLGCWNIWGLNSSQKQKEVQFWTRKNNLDIIGIVEVKVQSQNLSRVTEGLGMPDWDFISSGQDPHLLRIMVGWNKKKGSLTCIDRQAQWITVEVTPIDLSSPYLITFVYGLHTSAD
ncbi:hypothetical protein OIU77_020396, partial [Salix suchowensis]